MEALALRAEGSTVSSVTHSYRTVQCDLLLAGLEAALVDAGRALDAAGVAGLEAASSIRLPGLLAGWAAKPVPSWPHRWGTCSLYLAVFLSGPSANGILAVVLAIAI